MPIFSLIFIYKFFSFIFYKYYIYYLLLINSIIKIDKYNYNIIIIKKEKYIKIYKEKFIKKIREKIRHILENNSIPPPPGVFIYTYIIYQY